MAQRKYDIPHFHLMPPKGWLNDPNGLCQLGGIHHIFFQYSPDNPRGSDKYWGHYETKDFINYNFTGIFLSPDSRADKDGVYSGCVYVEDDTMYIYYTGNVKYNGDFDYIYNGREGNTVLVTSKDGMTSTPKEWLLKNEDYPDNLSNHVRDPKVFLENGIYYMVLGARTKDDKGCVMLYTSKDKRTWTFNHFIEQDNFGYMWECPDLFRLEGHQYLSISPQGLKAEEYKYQNIYQSGYFRATKDLLQNGDGLSRFTEWDYGFDFYAPQTYIDESGRRILIGWMGVPDSPYDHDPSIDEGWQHMLTIPRELHVDKETNRILQNPVEEMKALRLDVVFSGHSKGLVNSYISLEKLKKKGTFELILSEFEDEDFELVLHEGFKIYYSREENICSFKFIDDTLGYGRTERKIKLLCSERIYNMQILVDTCCMEIFINNGSYVFTTKYFKQKELGDSLCLKGNVGRIIVYALKDFTITNFNVGRLSKQSKIKQ